MSKQSDYDAPEVTMRTRRVLYESDDSAIVVSNRLIIALRHTLFRCLSEHQKTAKRA